MTTQEWITIISQGAGAAVAIVAIVATVRKFLMKHHADFMSGIVQLAQGVARNAVIATEDIGKLPGAGAVQAVMGTELHSIEDTLRKSRILQTAGTALHSFETSLGNLTSTQKGSAGVFVQTELKKLGITVTPAEVLGGLLEAQKAADALKATPLFAQTKQIDKTAQAMQDAAAPAAEGAKA